MFQLQSTNPVLTDEQTFEQTYGEMAGRRSVATFQGVVNKTGILLLIAVLGGAFGYWFISQGASMTFMTISCLASMGIGFGIFLVLFGRPHLAKYLAPIYGIVEGAFLGMLSASLDQALVRFGVALPGGVAVPAFVITLCVLLAMLGLYSARIIKPSNKLFAVVGTMTGAIMLVYLLSWPLAMFGIEIPFISLNSAIQGGMAGWIGLGINVLILGVAALWLVFDFKLIEDMVNEGASRDMEWYGGFALLVTLAWIYYESVKLVFRLALMFSQE